MDVEYKNIDPKLIVNEIRNGRSLEAVQKLYGIRFKSEVQDLYLRGLMELGEIPKMGFAKESSKESEPVAEKPKRAATPARSRHVEPEVEYKQPARPKPVVRRRHKAAPAAPSILIKTPNHRTIGQSGSITLNKALLIDQLGFSVGDSFEIYREDDRIVLKKLSEPLL